MTAAHRLHTGDLFIRSRERIYLHNENTNCHDGSLLARPLPEYVQFEARRRCKVDVCT